MNDNILETVEDRDEFISEQLREGIMACQIATSAMT